MSFCVKCGSSVPNAARFCNTCGTPVNSQPGMNQNTKPLNVQSPAVMTSIGGCRYHPSAPVVGRCADCHNGFCADCAIEIVRHGTVCLDCGSRFAQRKTMQAYIAAGLGLLAGILIASNAASAHNWGFAVAAPFIYAYLFAAVFFGWHYGGKIWKGLATAVDHMTGTAGLVGSIFLLSVRLAVAVMLGVFGGGIVQYLRYRNILKCRQSLSSAQQPSGPTASEISAH